MNHVKRRLSNNRTSEERSVKNMYKKEYNINAFKCPNTKICKSIQN